MTDYKQLILDTADAIASNKIHPFDGCLILSDCDEALGKKEFGRILRAHDSFADVCHKGIAFISDGPNSLYHQLREKRKETPLAERTKPNYFIPEPGYDSDWFKTRGDSYTKICLKHYPYKDKNEQV